MSRLIKSTHNDYNIFKLTNIAFTEQLFSLNSFCRTILCPIKVFADKIPRMEFAERACLENKFRAKSVSCAVAMKENVDVMGAQCVREFEQLFIGSSAARG